MRVSLYPVEYRKIVIIYMQSVLFLLSTRTFINCFSKQAHRHGGICLQFIPIPWIALVPTFPNREDWSNGGIDIDERMRPVWMKLIAQEVDGNAIENGLQSRELSGAVVLFKVEI